MQAIIEPTPQNKTTGHASLKEKYSAIATMFCIQGIIFSCIASRVPDFKMNLGLNDAQLGLLLFAMPLGQMVTMALSGYVVGRFSSKRVLKFSICLLPFFFIFVPIIKQYELLACVLFICGMIGNTINISMNTQALRAENVFKKTLMPSLHGTWSLASALGGLIGVFFIQWHFSMLSHFSFILFLFVTCGLYANRFLFLEDKAKVAEVKVAEVQEVNLKHKDSKDAAKGRKNGILSFFLIFCGFIGFLSALCEGVIYNWSSLYFKEVLNLSDGLSRIGFITGVSAMVIGRFTAGKFIEKYGKPPILLFCGSCITIGLILLTSFQYFVIATIGMLFLGIGASAVVPMVYSYAGSANPQNPSKAMASVVSMTFLGFLCGPPFIGFLSHHLTLKNAFIPLIAFGICIALSSLYFKIHGIKKD